MNATIEFASILENNISAWMRLILWRLKSTYFIIVSWICKFPKNAHRRLRSNRKNSKSKGTSNSIKQ